MRMSFLLSFFILFLSFQAIADNVSVTFYDGDFESAKIKAGEEGKLFFVDFYASWCAPCKWMDETAFSDAAVIKILNKDYIAFKVNIDDFDGYAWKQKYNVKVLPTMMIFNSSGELIERVEETLSARKLEYMLTKFNTEENRKVVKHEVNQSPGSITKQSAYSSESNLSSSLSNSAERNHAYRIQLGVFKEFENTYSMVNNLKSRFLDPVIVLNDIEAGEVRYKVMMGEFQTEKEAEIYREILEKDYNLKGLVK